MEYLQIAYPTHEKHLMDQAGQDPVLFFAAATILKHFSTHIDIHTMSFSFGKKEKDIWAVFDREGMPVFTSRWPHIAAIKLAQLEGPEDTLSCFGYPKCETVIDCVSVL